MTILSLPYLDFASLINPGSVDYIEYRLDFCPDPALIDFEAFTSRHILTWRGIEPDSPYLAKMLESRALVDLDIGECDSIDNLDKIIVSLHLAEYNEHTIKEFLSFSRPCFAQKIVFNAVSFGEILACSRQIAASRKKVIFNVCGKWAAFQRSLYRYFNSWGVYLFWETSTYPGQLSLEVYQQITGKGIAPNCQIYGIIGGEQVNQSLGLCAYNRLFADTDKHYLPIPVQSAEDATQVLMWLKTHFTLGAFSLTSPYKKSLPLALAQREGIYNSLKYSANGQFTWYNTDLIALDKSLHELQIHTDDSILIYGSGDCAEAFIAELLKQGYKKLYLEARNPINSSRLKQLYILPQNTPKHVKLVINASAGLVFENEPGKAISTFESLIELPYSSARDSTLSLYAAARDLPYINGEKFFYWQFEAQKAFWGL